MEDFDIEKGTRGLFTPRITSEGVPVSFRADGDALVVVRERGSDQTIDCTHGLGAVALCRWNGDVLGYGSIDISQIGMIAESMDEQLGRTDGRPLERLATHGFHLVLPIDAMPPEIRDRLLEERIDPDFVAEASLDDDLIEELMEEGHHDHHHDHGAECQHCASGDEQDSAMERLRAQIETMVSELGHAVIMVMPDAGTAAFSYTIGLGEAGWPEIVMTGIQGEQSREILNQAVKWLRRRETAPRDGMVLADAVNVPLRLRSVTVGHGHRYAKIAAERHVHKGMPPEEFQVLQLLWPDVSGLYPDQEGYDGTGLPPQKLI